MDNWTLDAQLSLLFSILLLCEYGYDGDQCCYQMFPRHFASFVVILQSFAGHLLVFRYWDFGGEVQVSRLDNAR